MNVVWIQYPFITMRTPRNIFSLIESK